MIERRKAPIAHFDDGFSSKSEAYEAFDDIPTNPIIENTLGDVLNARFDRRDMMRGALGISATVALMGSSSVLALSQSAEASSKSRYHFDEIAADVDETHHVAEGYNSNVLIRWGDPIKSDAPAFDPQNQSASSQLQQFGYNNDYCGYLPINGSSKRGLLCVNHEYTNEELMFPGLGRQDGKDFTDMTKELVDTEMAAHGGTVIEVAASSGGTWSPVLNSSYNRRISPYDTEMMIDGPAAGHDLLKTIADPTGTKVTGTLNNCAGGMTPWGTYLMAEENFHGYFWTDNLTDEGKPDLAGDQVKSWKRYGVPGRWYVWGRYHDRFNIDKEPNESNRFGYVVEVDPMDPGGAPVKHTALGRFRHEGAETILSRQGHAVVYSGDDGRFEFLYKFISKNRYDPNDKAANKNLLSDGTLYVAKFKADGTVEWMPMIYGNGPLTAENGFHNQADISVKTRLAADLLKATPMDRPEDVQPGTGGRVYVMLTNNHKRKPGDENSANPRAENYFGHIVEISEANGDPAASSGLWEFLVKCGDPSVGEVGAQWNPATSAHGWFAAPDNATVDADGRLWISTDQGKGWSRTGKSDGLYGLEIDGKSRGHSKLFFRAPIGAEVCGPIFTDDGESLFLAIQHPASDGVKFFPGFERNSTFEDPATRWPDFEADMPPRPSVMVITKTGGGKIAG